MTIAPSPYRHSERRATHRVSADDGADDRREHLRRMLGVPALLGEPHRANTVQLIDICRAGAAFASLGPLALGDIIQLSFTLPTSAATNTVSGEVVYCRLLPTSGRYKTGVRLHPMPDEIVERIVDFVTAPYIP